MLWVRLGWSSGREGDPAPCSKPRAAAPCPQVSPAPPPRPCPPQRPGAWLQPMAASTGSLCAGRPGSSIRAGEVMVVPEPQLPSGHRAGAGAVPLGSRDAVRPWQRGGGPSPPLGTYGVTSSHAGGPGDAVTPWTHWSLRRAHDGIPGEEGQLPTAQSPPRSPGDSKGLVSSMSPSPGPTCGHQLCGCCAVSPCPVWLLCRGGCAGDCV